MTSVAGHWRQQAILDQLHTYRYVRIKDLVAELQVSYPTVVRDLVALERRALLRRVHGGALVSISSPAPATRPRRSPTDGGRAATDALPRTPDDRAVRAAVRATRVIRGVTAPQPPKPGSAKS